MVECICQGTHHRWLHIDCPNQPSHEEWARRNRRPVAYHDGTFHVEPRCLCLGNHRYFSVRCPNVDSHGRHADQDWYSESPVFEEGYMRAAKDYHVMIMAEADPDGWWSKLGRDPEGDA